MTVTTIKVPSELRDRLKLGATERRVTLAEFLDELLLQDEKRRRFDELRQAMAANPPDRAYEAERDEWLDGAWQ